MKHKGKKKPLRRIRIFTAWCAAIGTVFGASFTACASPEFAYPPEKWEALRDNVMEYGELADLIHEYNATVINNRLAYDEYRGKSHDDLKNAYQDLADQMYESSDRLLDSVNEDQPGYGAAAAQAALSRVQAEQNQDLADAQNEDGAIKKLEYERAEAELVQQAQTKMISYWQKEAARPSLEAACALAESQYEAASLRAGAGMLSQAELLAAGEKAESARAALHTNEKEQDALRGELCVLLGWAHDASPEIRPVPIPTEEELAGICLEEDLERAEAVNYVQRANEGRLKYTSAGGNQREIMEKRIAAGAQNIRADVSAKHRLLEQAREQYSQAQMEWELAESQMASAGMQRELGMISVNQYREKQAESAGKKAAFDQAGLSLRQAFEDYIWSVNGLAAAE